MSDAALRRVMVLARALNPNIKPAPVACSSGSSPAVHLERPPAGCERAYEVVCTPEAVAFVAELVEAFDLRFEQVSPTRCQDRSARNLTALFQLQRRRTQRKSVSYPLRLPEGGEGGGGSWRVAPAPPRLRSRHLDLGDVSPADQGHFLRALSARAQGVQVDFDDGHCPSWRNQLVGLHNVYRAVHGLFPETPQIESIPVLMLRPRAWNMMEHHMMVNGKEVPGPLFDFGFLIFHNARKLFSTESGPYFYLSKLEGASEAQMWNDIFIWTQQKLGLPVGTIKACVLIENILSSFEMDEILFALKDHSLGLNCGIWDYSASIICKFGYDKNFILPDRNKYVDMNQHFLKSYMRLVVRTCHKRGAHATGGMAAALLPEEGDPRREHIIQAVSLAKLQEIQEGVDGFMVYDTGLVPHMNQLWQNHAPGENQIALPLPEHNITAQDLLQLPRGGVTAIGLKHNIEVAVMFIYHWFLGQGHFKYNGCVEDSATAEISRSQVWQWIRHQAKMEEDNAVVSKELVSELVYTFFFNCTHGKDGTAVKEVYKLYSAVQVFMKLVCKREFPEFITTYLNESQIFWSFVK